MKRYLKLAAVVVGVLLLTIVAGSDFLHQAWAAVDKRA